MKAISDVEKLDLSGLWGYSNRYSKLVGCLVLILVRCKDVSVEPLEQFLTGIEFPVAH